MANKMYNIVLNKPTDYLTQAVDWCMHHTTNKWTLETRWPAHGAKFYFEDQHDLLNFTLRWS
jgi:hypothetical protein